jgi:hypothetical protein
MYAENDTVLDSDATVQPHPADSGRFTRKTAPNAESALQIVERWIMARCIISNSIACTRVNQAIASMLAQVSGKPSRNYHEAARAPSGTSRFIVRFPLT